MPRGQSLTIRCSKCGKNPRVAYCGKSRIRTYVHGKTTGLPDSFYQWRVKCNACGHEWWSRHPDAWIAAGYPNRHVPQVQQRPKTCQDALRALIDACNSALWFIRASVDDEEYEGVQGQALKLNDELTAAIDKARRVILTGNETE